MDNDDRQVGRLLSRREVLLLMGGAGLALAVGCSDDSKASPTATSGSKSAVSTPTRPAVLASGATVTAGSATAPSCVVVPVLTEGPYFVDEKIERSDIRSDPSDNSVRDGAPLRLAFNVSSVGDGACTPLKGATIDVWHCDAAGVYSDVQDPGFSTKGKRFLRGYQTTDAAGTAQFLTIYPGWYQGRTVHIHFKIRNAKSGGGTFEFRSQLFFDDGFTDQVFAQSPYKEKGIRTLRNDGDMIYRDGGDQLLLDVKKTSDGYAATFDIGLKMT
jgi:protocatechuate 3,4-dioxygenase beta subunit